jgi:hypothetical protein
MDKQLNKFSVKSTMYVTSNRGRDVDGPWKPTVDAAIASFGAMLAKKGWEDQLVFGAFVAERCPEEVAPSGDSKGNYYKGAEVKDLDQKLENAGVKIGEWHRRSIK